MSEIVRKVSYSQYSLWAACPMQWKANYIDDNVFESGIELVFGTAMHNTIQEWLRLYYTEPSIKAKTFDGHEYMKEQLMKLVHEELIVDGKQLTTPKEVAEYYADGCHIFDEFQKRAKEWFPKNRQLIGIEVPLEFEIRPGIQFRGYIDIVVYHKMTKKVYIYDFKTARRGWSWQKKDEKKLDQLLLYKRFYSQLFNVPEINIHVEFIILKRSIVENSQWKQQYIVGFEPSHGTRSVKKATERFDKFLDIFQPDGSPAPDTLVYTPSTNSCRYCILRSSCAVSEYKEKDTNDT